MSLDVERIISKGSWRIKNAFSAGEVLTNVQRV
jgi:hypothetical protein